jgi:acylphosphatase
MKKCLKITISGKVQGEGYRSVTQKHAQSLGIEGTLQGAEEGSLVIFACGQSENLDKFIDFLYKGAPGAQVAELSAEPFLQEKDFRSVFRIIGL